MERVGPLLCNTITSDRYISRPPPCDTGMLLSNALSAATGLAIGHVLTKLSAGESMQRKDGYACLQRDAFPLYSAIEDHSSSPLDNARAAFLVGYDVLYLVDTIQSVNDYIQKDPKLKHLPTRFTSREPKAEKIVLRNRKAPEASTFISLLQDFNACFIREDDKRNPTTVLQKADALVAFTLQCIAYFLSQGETLTEEEWYKVMFGHDSTHMKMWYAWTQYYDKLRENDI